MAKNNANPRNQYSAAVKKNLQTGRDKAKEVVAATTEATKLRVAIKTIDATIAALKAQLIKLDDDIATLQGKIDAGSTEANIKAWTAELKTKRSQRDSTSKQLVSAQLNSIELKSQLDSIAATSVKAAAKTVTALAAGVFDSSAKNATGGLLYNASAVREAYFSRAGDDISGYLGRVQGPNNSPAAVSQAKDLWTSVSAAKGMIVTSEQVLKAWNTGSNKPQSSYWDNHNYGFQFQYNPGTVSMSYYTSPNVDVTMMTSGTEMFNLAGVSGSQGSIGFQVVINRIFDMQYYDANGALKGGYNGGDLYPVPPTTVEDYRDLYEKGTMYDVEYLLRVLMGTTMDSYLRGQKTADMGWLPAIPVELHLGKSLRYLGTINSINLNHIIFDSRMVPLFTMMDIQFVRLPDYPPANATPMA